MTSKKGFLALGLVAALATGALARDRVQSNLVPTAAAPGAKGSTRLIVQKASDGKFEVKVKKLARNATYDVLIGTVNVGRITTNGGGNGGLRFRTKPRGHDTALGFDPRGGTVEVRDGAGETVLTGDVPDGSGDPTDVVCCIPDDSGSECEDRTADACAAAGGTVSTATSCLPNPCGDSASGALVACCEPEDDGTPECELRTATACLAHGGTSVDSAVCDPNPCTATFPPTDIQCCLTKGGENEVECEDRTPDECAAQGGVNMGAGSCSPDPCTGATAPGGDDDGGGNGGGNGGGRGNGGSRGGHGGEAGHGGHGGDD